MNWAVGEARLFQWVRVSCRADAPGGADLQPLGWTVEGIDPRYGSLLVSKPDPRSSGSPQDLRAEGAIWGVA